MLGLAASGAPFVAGLEEDLGLGMLFKLRGGREAAAEVLIVGMDKESARRLDLPGDFDKWPRSLHARLVDRLAEFGAEVIVFNVPFSEPGEPLEDAALAESLRKAGNVVLCEELRPERRAEPAAASGAFAAGEAHAVASVLPPTVALARAAAGAAPFVLPAMPLRVNSYWTFQPLAGDAPSVPLTAFELYARSVYPDFLRLLGMAAPEAAARLPLPAGSVSGPRDARDLRGLSIALREVFESRPRLAQTMLELLEAPERAFGFDSRRRGLLAGLIKAHGGESRRYINYFGPPRTAGIVSYHEVLRDDFWLDARGKAVFVGIVDLLPGEGGQGFYTVFSRPGAGVFSSDVEIAATAFSDLAADSAIKPLPSSYYLALLFCWGFVLGAAGGLFFDFKIVGFMVWSTWLLYLFAAAWRFRAGYEWYPLVVPLFLQAPLALAGAMFAEYARLFRESGGKTRMTGDPERARGSRQSMAAQDCPELKGYQIAACSVRAREVGGDFFDCLELGRNELGLIIGDVTGRSVSGALFMVAVRSVFRMLVDGDSRVSEVMARANDWIKGDVVKTRGMFVALLYAVVDGEKRTLTFCNAGLTAPFHLVSRRGEVRMLENPGGSFPLGVMDEIEYRETGVRLEPGDLLIFYTDGVVGASGRSGEIYGLERLAALIGQQRDRDVQGVVEAVINDVHAFSGRSGPGDDLTVVAVKVEDRAGGAARAIPPCPAGGEGG